MSELIVNENGTFRPEELCGYVGRERPELLREAFELWGDELPHLKIVGQVAERPRRSMLWEYTRRLLGKDTPNYAQEIGDCFPANSLVTMADGSSRAIQDVRVGDAVRTPQGNIRHVLDTFTKKYTGEIHTIQAEGYRSSIRCTSDHQFVRPKGEDSWDWSPASILDTETNVLTSSEDGSAFAGLCGDSVRVESNLTEEVGDLDVYCIEVEHDHAFIVNGYAVHNCVSFGMKNAIEHVQVIPILNGEPWEFKYVFPPYFYGISRVQIGGGRIWGDGSVGAWAATGVLKYGVLASDVEEVPGYSGSTARSWGKSGPPAKFIEVGKKHLVKSAALVTTTEQAKDALANGYAVTIASNYGFRMNAGSSGFHEASGTWNHQKCLIGYDEGGDGIPEHWCDLNSWGDVHGEVKDFRDPSVVWPKGTLRIRTEVVAKILAQGDSFAVSPFDAFPSQKLPRSAFELW